VNRLWALICEADMCVVDMCVTGV